jgi:hypothetical protein
MPMKISLALGPRRALSSQTAWGCLTTNLAVPGFGSLVAGRASGYPQAALGICGLALTLFFGVRFIWWSISNWSLLHGPQADPIDALGQMWVAGRWAFFGILIFAIGWLWALFTSFQVVRSARNNEQLDVPPRLV